MKYQRGTETPIECVSVEAILDAESVEELPQWVRDALARGKLRVQRNLIEIIGGLYASTAARRDMLCLDETREPGEQVYYLSVHQFKRFKKVE